MSLYPLYILNAFNLGTIQHAVKCASILTDCAHEALQNYPAPLEKRVE